MSGVGLNTGFLRDLLDLPVFIAGRPHTALIPETWPDGWARPPLDPRRLVEAALSVHLARADSEPENGPWSALGGWRITENAGRPDSAMHYVGGAGGPTCRIRLAGRNGCFVAETEGRDPVEIRAAALRGGRLVYEAEEQRRDVGVVIDNERVTLLQSIGGGASEVMLQEIAKRL